MVIWEEHRIRTLQDIVQDLRKESQCLVFMVFGADGMYKSAVANDIYNCLDQAIFLTLGGKCEGSLKYGLDAGAAVIVLDGETSVSRVMRREWAEYLRVFQAKTLVGVYAKAVLRLDGGVAGRGAMQVAQLSENTPDVEGYDYFLVAEETD